MSWIFARFAPKKESSDPESATATAQDDDNQAGLDEELDGRCMEELNTVIKETFTPAAIKDLFRTRKKPAGAEGEIYQLANVLPITRNLWMHLKRRASDP